MLLQRFAIYTHTTPTVVASTFGRFIQCERQLINFVPVIAWWPVRLGLGTPHKYQARAQDFLRAYKKIWVK